MHMQTNKTTNHHSQLVKSQVLYDALVLDARFRQSLVTVRSLGKGKQ
jgi:hypothetical protein